MEVTTATASFEQLAREQAALRRVATLVAREPSPDEVFTAVAREAGLVLGAQRGTLLRVAAPQLAEVVRAGPTVRRRRCPWGIAHPSKKATGSRGQMLQ